MGHFLYGATDESALRNVRKSLQNLRALGLVKFMTYEPEDPEEYQSGSIPRVYGLSGKGVSYARKHFPELGAEELSQSRRTLEHDVKCARTFFHFVKMSEANGLEPYCKRGDLYRRVDNTSYIDPDWLFGAYDRMTFETRYYFLEAENEKKNFKKLSEKCGPYQKLYGTDQCLKQWGDFSDFKVILQFADRERRDNFRSHLAGECHCTYYRGKLKHTCNPKAPLKSANFWFTTDAQMYGDTAGKIFTTPADYAAASYSFLDL